MIAPSARRIVRVTEAQEPVRFALDGKVVARVLASLSMEMSLDAVPRVIDKAMLPV